MPDTVPYQAYRSKRQSHTPSNSNSGQFPLNVSPPPVGPLSFHNVSTGREKDPVMGYPFTGRTESPTSQAPEHDNLQRSGLLTPPDERSNPAMALSLPRRITDLSPETESSAASRSSSPPVASTSIFLNSPQDESQPVPRSKTPSTFRHVPPRNPRIPTPTSLLGPQRHTPAHSLNVSISSTSKNGALSQEKNSSAQSMRPTNSLGQPTVPSVDEPILFLDSLGSIDEARHQSAASADLAPPAADTPALQYVSRVFTPSATHKTTTLTSSSTSAPQRIVAPYRPGFQPRGVNRLLTDDFVALRQAKQEAEGSRRGHGMSRAEKRKLERRLEKLIAIHFPLPSEKKTDLTVTRGTPQEIPGVTVGRSENWRVSSFVDFDIGSITIQDAGELWRGIFGSDEAATIRAAEQRITPWQDDATISKCPLCGISFHPITNRKHHCRLCGQIICSLSPKLPQRPITCSLLFVVDPKTRKIEEVGEGVDYGVKRRRIGSNDARMSQRKVEDLAEDDKFLKGIRICRTCRPVLLRQVHQHDAAHVPIFVKLYEAFISLEREIEEYVPQFQDLILSLSHNTQPTREASSMRKRLMEAFAQYDLIAKRIRKLPCPNGPGSSQDRVQMAIMTRANLFLQTNMVPLQSLSTPPRTTTVSPNPTSNTDNLSNIGGLAGIDADAKAALVLQPLLEQEALLESFVEEAQAQRKFEDVKTLKVNLGEIRAEIEKIFADTQGGI